MQLGRQRDGFTEEELLGAWECFKGDGIHGWDRRVLVFRRDGGQFAVDYWLPEDVDSAGALYLWGTCGRDCVPTEFGLRLRVKCQRLDSESIRTKTVEREEKIIDIHPDEGQTFLLVHPYTTAGGLYFRRTTWPIATGKRRGRRRKE